MRINGFLKLTLLDYPNHLACTLFTPGCNFRCPWCHNAPLVLHPEYESYTEDEIFDFLKKRQGILEGVCISGGEPTLQPDLIPFIKKIRSLGYLIKLDTNGTNPSVISSLLSQNLVDYIAMDIKNSKINYAKTCGMTKVDLSAIDTSVSLLLSGTIPYEFRTTVVKELHSKKDFEDIGQWLKGAAAYYLQSFVDSKELISGCYTAYDKKQMQLFCNLLKETIPNTYLRGIK